MPLTAHTHGSVCVLCHKIARFILSFALCRRALGFWEASRFGPLERWEVLRGAFRSATGASKLLRSLQRPPVASPALRLLPRLCRSQQKEPAGKVKNGSLAEVVLAKGGGGAAIAKLLLHGLASCSACSVAHPHLPRNVVHLMALDQLYAQPLSICYNCSNYNMCGSEPTTRLMGHQKSTEPTPPQWSISLSLHSVHAHFPLLEVQVWCQASSHLS